MSINLSVHTGRNPFQPLWTLERIYRFNPRGKTIRHTRLKITFSTYMINPEAFHAFKLIAYQNSRSCFDAHRPLQPWLDAFLWTDCSFFFFLSLSISCLSCLPPPFSFTSTRFPHSLMLGPSGMHPTGIPHPAIVPPSGKQDHDQYDRGMYV